MAEESADYQLRTYGNPLHLSGSALGSCAGQARHVDEPTIGGGLATEALQLSHENRARESGHCGLRNHYRDNGILDVTMRSNQPPPGLAKYMVSTTSFGVETAPAERIILKRSIIVGLASATIALGTATSASAAPVALGNPADAADSGSSNFFQAAPGHNSGSTDLANSVALAPFDLLCRLLSGEPLEACIPDNL
ncbi:hypothetical protein [Rhodococcus sp. NPDC059234]|uniref:hypothetical protein n=1 Tax=Rhodococcus sp. NPDC059234 TaxID=3346781 RepID=UPI003671B650